MTYSIIKKPQLGNIDDELKIANIFIEHINKNHNEDYCEPYHPSIDEGIDALAHKKSNPEHTLKMQITVADYDAREKFATKGEVLRVYNRTEPDPRIEKGIIEPIKQKSEKYSIELKRDLILLLDGWWIVGKLSSKEIKDLKDLRKKFFKGTGFLGIYLVYNKNIYKIYP